MFNKIYFLFRTKKPPIYIRTKLLTYIITVFLCIGIVTTAFRLYFRYIEEYRQTEQSLNIKAKATRPSLAYAIWLDSSEEIDNILAKFLSNPIIYSAKIEHLNKFNPQTQSQGPSIVSHSTTRQQYRLVPGPKNFLSYSFFIYGYEQEQTAQNIVGVCTLYSKKTYIMNNLKFDFLIIILGTMLNFSLLVIILNYCSNKFLTTPLNKLTKQLDKLTAIDLKPINQVTKFTDELYTLTNSFNAMLINLKSSQENNKNYTNSLIDSKKDLQSILNSLPAALVFLQTNFLIAEFNHIAMQLPSNKKLEPNKNIFDIFNFLLPYKTDIINALTKQQEFKLNRLQVDSIDSLFIKIFIYPLDDLVNGYVVRIDDITQEVLIEQNLLQEAKISAFGVLTSGMAHEINNPLGGISQSNQNILRRLEVKNPKNMEIAQMLEIKLENVNKYLVAKDILNHLKKIKKMSDLSTTIVKNLLNLSHLGINKEQTNTHNLFKETVDIICNEPHIYSLIKDNTLQINYNLEPKIELIGNKPQIQQMLIELLEELIVSNIYTNQTYILNLSANQISNKIYIYINDNCIQDTHTRTQLILRLNSQEPDRQDSLKISMIKKILKKNNASIQLQQLNDGLQIVIILNLSS